MVRPPGLSGAGLKRLLSGLGACLLCAVSLSVQAQAPARYSAVEYARLNNPGAITVVRNINSFSEVAGAFQTDPRKASSALVFAGSNLLEDVVGSRGAGNSVAYGINDQNEVVGAYNAGSALRPFRAVRRVGFQELALPAGSNTGLAFSVNDLGEAAGYVSGASGIRPAWWNRRGEVQLLQSPGGQTTQAFDINLAGDVVGVTGDERKTAVLWPQKGGLVDLGLLPGFLNSQAVSIAENGTIVGEASGVGSNATRVRAVLWSGNTRLIQDLGTLTGGTDSRARDVNNRGEVVGTSSSAQGYRGFIWTAAGGMVDLNTRVSLPGLVITDAVSINKNGDIAVLASETHAHPDGTADAHEDHHDPRHVLILHPQ